MALKFGYRTIKQTLMEKKKKHLKNSRTTLSNIPKQRQRCKIRPTGDLKREITL